LAKPGAFFTCRVGNVPAVVVRGRNGELRAFVNVCRHRRSFQRLVYDALTSAD